LIQPVHAQENRMNKKFLTAALAFAVLGGLGLPDPVTRETVDLLTALAYVRARRIESIHPTDTSLWVLADGGLYRVELSTIP